MGGGSNAALVQTNSEGQSASNRGIGKVLRLLIDFLCVSAKMTAAKTNPTKCKGCSVVQFYG